MRKLLPGDMKIQSLQIIELSIGQWQAYRDLRLAALHDSPQAFSSTFLEQQNKPDEYWQLRLQAAAEGESSWLLFARNENSLVGMIGAFRDPSSGVEACIVSMYVIPRMRGQGVAGTLMQSMLSLLRERGVCKARLNVNLQQTAALHLYQRFGFQIIFVEPALMGDGVIYDEALMETILE